MKDQLQGMVSQMIMACMSSYIILSIPSLLRMCGDSSIILDISRSMCSTVSTHVVSEDFFEWCRMLKDAHTHGDVVCSRDAVPIVS